MKYIILVLSLLAFKTMAIEVDGYEVSTKHLPSNIFGSYENYVDNEFPKDNHPGYRKDGRTWQFNSNGTYTTTYKAKSVKGEWGAVQKKDGSGIVSAPEHRPYAKGQYVIIIKIGYSNTKWFLDTKTSTFIDFQGKDQKMKRTDS
jgi:hypothetical protein